ncbi:MAG: hypothetical protein PHY12_11070 [Eubacteriales bacterium]|nr:hypothetical protein [Eubacteriales bacterium]MDD3411336.1 hypothetical protein [Eubacteriales bacterium]
MAFSEEGELPLSLEQELDQGLDTRVDEEPDEEYEPCYHDGSLQNECWKAD